MVQMSPHGTFARIWTQRGKNRSVFLMIALFLLVLVQPFFTDTPFGGPALSLLYTLIAAASVLSVMRSRRLLVAVCSLGIPWIVLSWGTRLGDLGLAVNLLTIALLVPFGLLLVTIMLVDVLRMPAVTGNTLCRAISGYMLIGISWAAMYQMLLLLDSESVHPLIPGEWGNCVYFSFTTLTTLGFGDVTPVSPYARSLVAIESVVGPMYLAILIARLVAAYGRTSTDPGP